MQLKQERLKACPVCGSEFGESVREVRAKDIFGVSPETFRLVKCDSCGSYVLNPRPSMSEMGIFYDSDFLADAKPAEGSWITALASKQQEFNLVSELRWLDRHLGKKARYLDYSAGNGQIVAGIKRRRPDIEVHATEFSAPYRESIAALIGGDRVVESIDDFAPGEKFDFISAFGVLEHVEDPRETIRKARERLADGGKLMLTVPNIDSFQRHLFGERWYSWLAPRHWHLMKMETIRRMLEELDFEIVGEKHFFLRTSSATIVLSAFPGLDPLRNKSPIAMMLYGALFYLLIPAEWIAAAFGRAGFMGVVAVKKG